MGNSSVCCVALFLAVTFGTADDAERPPSAEEVAAKAQAAMAEYLVKVGTRLCGTIHDKSGPKGGGDLWDERKVKIVQNGRYGYLIEEETNYYAGSRPVTFAMLYGPTVRAALRKGEDGKWSVTDCRFGEGRAVDCWGLTSWVAMGYMLISMPVRERSKQIWSDGVRLGAIEWDEVDGRRLLRVEFEIPEISPEGERGEVWLDPEWMWAMVKGRTERLVRGEQGWRVMRSEFRFEYNESYAPYPVPKKHRGHWIVEGATKNPEGWYEQIYDLSIPDEPPGDEEFTLARFGVPNVAGVPLQRRTAPWLWMGVLACLTAGLLWWVRTRMRRVGEGSHAGGTEVDS